MSTAVTPSQSVVASGGPNVWNYVPGLAWGTAMFGVLTWWLYARDILSGMPIVWGAGLLAIVSFLLFVWSSLRQRAAKGDPAALSQTGDEMRPLLGLAMSAGSVLLLVLAAWLCILEGLQVFAETSSMVTMALVMLGAGLSLLLAPTTALSRQKFFQWMLERRQFVAIALMTLGGTLTALGLYWVLKAKWDDFSRVYPGGLEGVGAILIGIVLASGGLFTFLNLQRTATLTTMRLLTLYAGSLSGFLLALFTAVRIGVWNRQFMGGMSTWQGDVAWRLWLCLYIELAGLLLLFGSLLLSRTDIRTNPAVRRLLYGYNAALTGLLLLATLVVANIIIFVTVPSNVEWRATGMHTLSATSIRLLEGLKDKVTVYVLMPRYSGPFLEIRDLLDNCQSVTDKVVAEYLSPDLDPERYRELVKLYPELQKQQSMDHRGGPGEGRGLLLVYGEGLESQKLPHVFIKDSELDDMEMGGMPGEPPGHFFKGEMVVMQSIQHLSENKEKPKVYFTQNNGEMWINEMLDRQYDDERFLGNQLNGASSLAEKLRKDNYDVWGLLWESKLHKKFPEKEFVTARKDDKSDFEVPADCKVLVVANPEKAYSKDVLAAIDRYLGRGGKVFVLTKAGILFPGATFADDGMEAFCRKFGVQVTNDFIIRFGSRFAEEVWQVKAAVPPTANNPVANAFPKKSFRFILPRTVKQGKGDSTYQVETILHVTEAANGEVWPDTAAGPIATTPLAYVRDMKIRDKIKDKTNGEPLSVGVAVTEKSGKPRAIILGDYTFVCDDMLIKSPVGSLNYDFFRSGVEWLAERKVVLLGDIPRTERRNFTLPKSEFKDGDRVRMVWLPLGLLVLGLAGTGAGVWIVRRK